MVLAAAAVVEHKTVASVAVVENHLGLNVAAAVLDLVAAAAAAGVEEHQSLDLVVVDVRLGQLAA